MEFVSFEFAKKLKDKGYPQVKQTTLAMYNEDGDWFSMAETIDEAYTYEDFDDRDFVCPVISQVLKWLREEKKIHICISYSDNINFMWEYEIILLEGVLYQNADGAYMSYEEAALAGIEYCLDNLI